MSKKPSKIRSGKSNEDSCDSPLFQDAFESLSSMKSEIHQSEVNIDSVLRSLEMNKSCDADNKMKDKIIRTRQKIQEDKQRLDKIELALRNSCKKR